MKKIIENFFSNLVTGIFALLPFIITYWVIIQLYEISKDSFLFLHKYFNDGASTTVVMIFILLLISGMGKLVKTKTKSIFINIQEKILSKIPFINTIYNFLKEIIELVMSKDKEKQMEVCMVKFAGHYSLGFINNKNENIYTVFVPTSPNPTNGFNLFVPKEEIIILEGIEKEEALANIVSLGVKETNNLKEEIKKLNNLKK